MKGLDRGELAKGLGVAFFLLCLSGGVGLLLDLDHLFACILVGKLPTPGDWSCGQGRPAHIGGFVVSFVVWVLGCAYLCGLFLLKGAAGDT